MTDARPLEARCVTKAFGATVAVEAVDLELAAGELVVVVGPSGCGKSTLLRLMAGLLPIDSGEVSVAGRVVDDGRRCVPPERRHVGLVFQDHALFPHLTVEQNVGFGLRGRSAGERRDAVGRLLEMVGLGDLGRRYPHEISGGERQRVSLARAIAPEPRLLLLDEPFASLDPTRRAQVRTDVVDLLRATGTPAILVTHDQPEALAVGDRVAVLRSGRVLQLDTPEAVYARPVDMFVAGFMGEARFLPVRNGADGPATELGRIDPTGDGTGGLAVIRPSDVVLEESAEGGAVVERAEYRGATWSYEVRMASGDVVLAECPASLVLACGAVVHASLYPHHRVVVVPAERVTGS